MLYAPSQLRAVVALLIMAQRSLRLKSGAERVNFKNLCAHGARAVSAAAATLALCVGNASAQTVTVVEYYNKAVDAYFITGRANEQTTLDAVADFQRTGMTFQATVATAATTAQTKICRFYISVANPYTSSHFYGRQGTDCESLLSQKIAGFSWEDYDFATLQPASGACPAGTTAIYRGFRAGANGKTSNHRYSASLATYNAAATAGYAGEGVVFCAASATPATATVVTPPSTGTSDCGAIVESKKKITTQTTTTTLGTSSVSTSVTAYDYDLTPVSFNGKSAARLLATATVTGSSNVSTPSVQYFQDNTNDYTLLGTRGGTAPVQDTYWEPGLVYPKKWTVGQAVNYTYAIVFSPVQSIGNGSQTGTTTFLGMESVTVPAGTFNACKFKVDQTTKYAVSTSITSATSWSVPNVGNVKTEITDTSVVSGFNVVSNYLVVATAIQ